jgi:pilus assembly protein Flp/PilA
MSLLKSLPALSVSIKNDRRGVTLIEYGLLAALIALVVIGAVTTLGSNLSTLFTNIGNSI